MVTILISTAFRGATLIRGQALIKRKRLFQCGYTKVRLLLEGGAFFEAQRLLEEIRYVKNANHMGIVWNSERIRKNIPANVKTDSSWKSGLQLILNVTVSLLLRLKLSCRRIFFYEFLKTLWQFFQKMWRPYQQYHLRD